MWKPWYSTLWPPIVATCGNRWGQHNTPITCHYSQWFLSFFPFFLFLSFFLSFLLYLFIYLLFIYLCDQCLRQCRQTSIMCWKSAHRQSFTLHDSSFNQEWMWHTCRVMVIGLQANYFLCCLVCFVRAIRSETLIRSSKNKKLRQLTTIC